MCLAPWLQVLVDQWVLTPLEADALQDFWMEAPEDLAMDAPEHLQKPLGKLWLHRQIDETTATRH